MIYHKAIDDENFTGKRILKLLIQDSQIVLGGSQQLKIYGTLTCSSGKRMKKENRVFFSSEHEAINEGFRPCGNCMKVKYQNWKNGII